MYILVTYDVDTTSKEGARRLRCVAKACLDYGQRVQNSVFECVVTEAQYSLLKGRVRDIIDMSLDSVRFYILSKNENKRVEVIGVEEVKDENGDFIPVEVGDTIYEKVYVLVDPKEVTLEDEKQEEETVAPAEPEAEL